MALVGVLNGHRSVCVCLGLGCYKYQYILYLWHEFSDVANANDSSHVFVWRAARFSRYRTSAI
jgi:hypothetical protein